MNFFSLFKRNLIYKFKKKISIDNDGINFKSLDSLFHHYESDKSNIFKKTGNKGHGYSKFYENKLISFKEKKINILEIGSYAGSSAASFVKYFPNSKVFCFDVNIANFKLKSAKIHVFGLDINDEKKVKKTLDKIYKSHNFKNFDIIVDDGSHNLKDILIGLKYFFKYLNTKGLFVIEDFKLPNYHKYNRDIDHVLIDQFLENLRNKKISYSNVLSKHDQIDLIHSIQSIEMFKGNLIDSDICFIEKK